MKEKNSILEESVIDEVKRYSIVDLIGLLFPGHTARLRGIMRSPFREDKHPSFSIFRGYEGYYFWKDLSTDETGDNISLYRKVFPELSYVDAVDALAHLTLGRSAKKSPSSKSYVRRYDSLVKEDIKPLEPERESRLRLLSDLPLYDVSVPSKINDYWNELPIYCF